MEVLRKMTKSTANRDNLKSKLLNWLLQPASSSPQEAPSSKAINVFNLVSMLLCKLNEMPSKALAVKERVRVSMNKLDIAKYLVHKKVSLKILSRWLFFITVNGVIHEVRVESRIIFLLLSCNFWQVLSIVPSMSVSSSPKISLFNFSSL